MPTQYCTKSTKRLSHSRGNNRSEDPHITTQYATTVTLNWEHNHEIVSADALRRRDVSGETRQKILELYRSGHSPSSALDTLKYDLHVEHGDDYTRHPEV
ncbi:hypothetical protein LSAT2_016173 [Lamellibrachia satsuma]|nr:hypothetical protein LSAT2_016173 [Lamellibrachia satsuma]